MDRDPSLESGPKIDFLDENVRITFEIEPEAQKHLPVITQEDKRSGMERFAVLVGNVKVRGHDRAHVVIKGIYEDSEEEKDRYGSYHEGVEQVTYDPVVIRARISELRENPQHKHLLHLGEIHTHPSSLQARPSEQDLLGIIEQYESGLIKQKEPYIFGIAGETLSGEMNYWFYRMILTPQGYWYAALDHND